MKNKVLIVDDSKDNLFVLEMFIKRYDPTLEVISANDGEESVRLYTEHHSDIKAIIMDRDMPIMNGVNALNMICDEYKRLTGGACLSADVVFHIFTSEYNPCELACKGCNCKMLDHVIKKPLSDEKIKILLGEE